MVVESLYSFVWYKYFKDVEMVIKFCVKLNGYWNMNKLVY